MRKSLAASRVDGAAKSDVTPRIDGACGWMITCWRRWLICLGSESSNMKEVFM